MNVRALASSACLLLGACAAHGGPAAQIGVSVAAPAPSASPLTVETPTPGTFIRSPESEVRGRYTASGKVWIYVESVLAEAKDGQFIARSVPLREGKMDLRVELTDAAGKKERLLVPIVVETPTRPQAHDLCDPATKRCLTVEVRGVPKRDPDGRIANAVVVLSAFGFDERLDEMWPGLIGPARPLDPRHVVVIGVAPGHGDTRPRAAEVPALLARLWAEERLSAHTLVVGASTFGSELVLRGLAARSIGDGPVLLCGGHDRPYLEPSLRALRLALPKPGAAAATSWQNIARVVVGSTYTDAYLANAANAEEHGLVEEARAGGLRRALVERSASLWARAVPLPQLAARIEDAFALAAAPLVWSGLGDRRVVFVANERDGTSSLALVRAAVQRLKAGGANAEVRSFSDDLGHAAFFLGAPAVLSRAVLDLVREAR